MKAVRMIKVVTACVASLTALIMLPGCPAADTGGNVNQNQNDNSNTNANDNTNTNSNSNANENNSDGTAEGLYDPVARQFTLVVGDIELDIPPDATLAPVMISIEPATAANLPEPLPGGVGFAGAIFGPDGQAFLEPATVRVTLSEPSIAPQLPVLTYDETAMTWVGTGELATVADDGMSAEFQLTHFSPFGLPDVVPAPQPGEEIGSFVVISNNGALASEEISSDSAALLFSEFGGTFNVSATSQSINMQGQIVTKAIGLDALLVSRFENYVVAVIGGPTSLFNAGQSNEPLVGVAIMSVSGDTANVSIYAASTNRVVTGTLTGPV